MYVCISSFEYFLKVPLIKLFPYLFEVDYWVGFVFDKDFRTFGSNNDGRLLKTFCKPFGIEVLYFY